MECITLMLHPFLKKSLVGAEVLKPRVMEMLKKRKDKERAAGEDFGGDNEIEAVIAATNAKPSSGGTIFVVGCIFADVKKSCFE